MEVPGQATHNGNADKKGCCYQQTEPAVSGIKGELLQYDVDTTADEDWKKMSPWGEGGL